ncbi:Short-chain dehydrogenase/reductase family protein [Mycena sanguinolenta]|uniref:Short-chain dehydrogenase/reductase family protein n=1 Tax=Mycena sanguinolenta TaxID=230812 RepID=A0A8H7CRY7_9AGAR|nr:Short-chain dehydrogenase/reductase family protein [Mycena sanguinolenta]
MKRGNTVSRQGMANPHDDSAISDHPRMYKSDGSRGCRHQVSVSIMSLPAFTPATTAEEVAAAFADQIQGRNVLITGTSIDGVGFEAARVLAKYANLVIITGYNSERRVWVHFLRLFLIQGRLKLSEEAIKREVPSANIRRLVLDLSSLAAVRKAAAEVNAYPEPLHVLIHNAAAGGGGFKLTVDGFESQIATNHIGPFLFTKLLAPKLLAARSGSYTPRVVVVSSVGHGFVPFDLDIVAHPNPDTYTFFGAYCQSKAANVLFANELSRRAKGKFNVYSLHPGTIHTNLSKKEENKDTFIAVGLLTPEGLPSSEKTTWKTLGQGAATTVAAAFDTRLDLKSGAYLMDSVEANDKIAPHCSDPDTAAKLWTITEEIVGEKFAL